VIAGERACPTCAASPLCDGCGHQRESDVGVFRAGKTACNHVWLDVPSLTKVSCHCAGFSPVVGRFRDARFADEPPGDEPPLRLA
jgi:hypothetical protein